MTLTDAQIEEAREMGRKAGRTAGSWAADGNTSDEHRRRVLKMLADGDPASETYLPRYPNLFADDPTPQSIARDILDTDEPDSDDVDALATAWEEGASETFEDACERELRAGLPTYTIDHTHDEFGEDRWFLADSNGDWIGDPFPTRELADAARAQLMVTT